MDENYRNPDTAAMQGDEIEIDWMGILSKILRNWKRIALVTFLFAVVGVASAMLMHRRYGVTVTLAPEVQGRSSSSLTSITSMLSLSGAQLSTSPDALNITLFPEICSSTPFLTRLFDVELTPYLSPQAVAAGATATPVTVFDHLIGADKLGYEKKQEKLRRRKDYVEIDESVVDPARLTKKQAFVVKQLGSRIGATVDKKTGITTISTVLDDRLMVTQLADTVCRRLQEYVIDYRTKKADADYQYYVAMAEESHDKLVAAQSAYAAAVDFDKGVLRQSVSSERQRLQEEVTLASQIYSQMVQQRELARAKLQEEKPVYAVIQPATMPQRPMNSRRKKVMTWMFAGFFLSVAWYGFGADLWRRLRGEVKEKMAEEDAA